MASAGLAFCHFVWKQEAAARRGRGATGASQSFDTWCFLSVSLGTPEQPGQGGQPCFGRPVLVPGTVTSVGPVSEQGTVLSSTVQALTCWGQLSESWLVRVRKGF